MVGGWLTSDHSLMFNSLPHAFQQPACDLQLLRPTVTPPFVISWLDKWVIWNPSEVSREPGHKQ
jgi:hypothetical protein